MAQTLSEQIKSALAPDARVTTVACLIFEVRRALNEAQAERDRHQAIAVSADFDDKAADEAADAELKAARRVARLTAQLAQVEARHAELERAAAAKRAQAERDGIIEERDKLVADLKERWPVLADEMLSLINRVVASEPRCRAIRVVGPEGMARGLGENYFGPAGPCPRIVEMDIIGLDTSGHPLRRGNKFWASGSWS